MKQLTVVFLLVLVVLFLYLATRHSFSFFTELSSRDGIQEPSSSLYDRLGGVFPIAAVVDRFSDALITNPVVGQQSSNPFLRDWHTNHLDRLPGLKWMRTLWVCSISGGPYKYIGTLPGKCPFSLENAHKRFAISPVEFNAVAEELSDALDYYKVPPKEKGEVLAAFAAHQPDIVTGYDIKNHIPVPNISC